MILEDPNFDFRYIRLCDLDIPRENWLTICILQCLIWVCTVCQLPFKGSPDYNGLTAWQSEHLSEKGRKRDSRVCSREKRNRGE